MVNLEKRVSKAKWDHKDLRATLVRKGPKGIEAHREYKAKKVIAEHIIGGKPVSEFMYTEQ